MNDPLPIDFTTWVESAAAELPFATDRVLRNAAALLESTPAVWHPNGFVVFDIGVDSQIGRLRFHVWPSNLEGPRAADEADIHSHAWHLCSEVVAGNYSEVIFDHLTHADQGFMRYDTHSIAYTENPNLLQSGGSTYLKPRDQQSFMPGQVHFIPAGTLHRTTVDASQFAATILFTSPVIEPMVTVIRGRPATAGLSMTRPPITRSERVSILAELALHLEGAPHID